MAQNNSSAEHELLKAIEGKADLAPFKKKASGETAKILKNSFMDWKRSFSRTDLKAKLTLRNINKSLIATVLTMMIIQFWVTLSGLYQIANIPVFDPAAIADISPGGGEGGIGSALKGYSYYVDKILGRNIFVEKTPDKVVVTEAPRPKGLEDMARELRLTGISWMEDTGERFALIEDRGMALTYYLREKETIKGFTIQRIDNTGVVLKRDGIEIELK